MANQYSLFDFFFKFVDTDVAPRMEVSPVVVGVDATTEGIGGGTEDV